MPTEEIRFVIDIEVSDVERFKEIATKCAAVSRDEPGTLIYDWYVDAESGRGRLYEAYASREALHAHVTGPVFRDVGIPLMETCTFVHVDAFGDVDESGPSMWPTSYWGQPFATLGRSPRSGNP